MHTCWFIGCPNSHITRTSPTSLLLGRHQFYIKYVCVQKNKPLTGLGSDLLRSGSFGLASHITRSTVVFDSWILTAGMNANASTHHASLNQHLVLSPLSFLCTPAGSPKLASPPLKSRWLPKSKLLLLYDGTWGFVDAPGHSPSWYSRLQWLFVALAGSTITAS